ncbi:AAA family ATPase [Nocardioides jensenii]|uniref:AAA family ATPase n=1 Tax=Nocardioides jensenii TaxID=1843 RepID=UPI00082D53FE|nr:AAA family ATPase [Nocardioides jensenii]
MIAPVVAAVADLLADVRRPVLVAIDGPDGSGKTHVARALATELTARGLTTAHASVDSFHHPREHRHALGRTPEAVWGRHFDYRAMRRELLDPWRRGPGATYTPVWHDVDADTYVDRVSASVPERGVLVVDGVFLQRPELVDAWDLAVYLDAPPEVTVARMSRRDGTPDDVGHPDQQRYLRAQEIYRETCDPLGLADLVIDNADWENPALRTRSGVGPAWRRVGEEIVREVRLPVDAAERAAAIDRLSDAAG